MHLLHRNKKNFLKGFEKQADGLFRCKSLLEIPSRLTMMCVSCSSSSHERKKRREMMKNPPLDVICRPVSLFCFLASEFFLHRKERQDEYLLYINHHPLLPLIFFLPSSSFTIALTFFSILDLYDVHCAVYVMMITTICFKCKHTREVNKRRKYYQSKRVQLKHPSPETLTDILFLFPF